MSDLLKAYTDRTSAPEDGSEHITRTAVGTKECLDVYERNPNLAGFIITNAIESIAFDLSGSAFSATTNISNDYIADRIEFNFSSTESRDITLTTSDGTELYKTTSDTSLDIHIDLEDIGFNADENLTIDVTQTSGACTMDVVMTVKEGSSSLLGNPVLGAGTNNIGDVDVVSSVLPTGAATAANQLADGHNVTVDNASGGSAVNVQDGGNEITVDQSTHDNLNANANLQVANVDASSSNRVPVEVFDSSGVTVDTVRPFDFGLEVGLGNISGYSKVNKFGAALDCDNGVLTDIWDGADGTTSTDIWVAPTTARTHTIASTSTADDFSDSGTGCRTVRVYGLTSWGSSEVNEDIELDGNGANAQVTSNSYVIVHRIVGLTFGSGGTNAGIITCTADTDGTVTAAVQAGEGQTLMCIYGVPSTQTIHLFGMRADILRSVVSVTSDLTLLVKENADVATAGFVTKERFQFSSSSPLTRFYQPLKSFTGPCIVKLQVDASANNSSVTAGFDAFLVDN